MGLLDVEGTCDSSLSGIWANGAQVENADDWSYQRGLEGGWIPQDPSDRLYPNICS